MSCHLNLLLPLSIDRVESSRVDSIQYYHCLDESFIFTFSIPFPLGIHPTSSTSTSSSTS